MKGYYIIFIDKDIDNYDISIPHLEYDIFLDKTKAEAKVLELNEPYKKEWEKENQRMIENIKHQQKKWNALKNAGLSSGSRPIILTYLEKTWETGRDRYYDVDYVEIKE